MSVDGRGDQLKSKLDIKLFAEKPELQEPVEWITTSRWYQIDNNLLFVLVFNWLS